MISLVGISIRIQSNNQSLFSVLYLVIVQESIAKKNERKYRETGITQKSGDVHSFLFSHQKKKYHAFADHDWTNFIDSAIDLSRNLYMDDGTQEQRNRVVDISNALKTKE